MKGKTIEEFVLELASSSPTPGGGSVAALVGALSAALGCMVANITLAREPNAELERRRDALLAACKAALNDIQDDVDAYGGVVVAQKLPKSTDAEKVARTAALQAALQSAAQAPLQVAQRTTDTLELAAQVAPMARTAYVSDLGVANFLALAAVMSSALNVETNLHALHDADAVQSMHTRLVALEARAHTLFEQLEVAVKDRMTTKS